MAQMPRYYFELDDGKSRLRDEDGEEFSSLPEAANHGRVVAYELARNHAPSRLNGSAVLVLDETGAELARIPLRDAGEAVMPPSSSERPLS